MDRKQRALIRSFQTFKEFCLDLAWMCLGKYALEGRLGLCGKMVRAAAAFERKTRWTLRPDKPDPTLFDPTMLQSHERLPAHAEFCADRF